MDSPTLRRALAAALALLALIALLLWAWPAPPSGPRAPEQAVQGRAGGAAVSEPPAEVARIELIRGVPVEELPDPTEKCVTLVEWNNRNVPAWVIEKNMDAQAMRFDERDLACMEAGRLPEQVLDRAEQNRLRPQPAPR